MLFACSKVIPFVVTDKAILAHGKEEFEKKFDAQIEVRNLNHARNTNSTSWKVSESVMLWNQFVCQLGH